MLVQLFVTITENTQQVNSDTGLDKTAPSIKVTESDITDPQNVAKLVHSQSEESKEVHTAAETANQKEGEPAGQAEVQELESLSLQESSLNDSSSFHGMCIFIG